MVYYVAYKPPPVRESRTQLVHQLKTMGLKQVRGSLWVVEAKDLSAAKALLQEHSPVIMKRIREIRKPSFMKDLGRSDLGNLIVVAYRIIDKEEREKVENRAKTVPCLRISRGVCAFPQRQSFFDKNSKFMDASRFYEYVREFDDSAVMIPRLIFVNSGAVERLTEETRRRIEREVWSIIEGFKALYQRMMRDEIDRRHVLKTARKLRKRFAIVKRLATFYGEWLNVDLSKSAMKPYPAIKKVRLLFEEKYEAVKM
jgi:hypothetical protein